MTSTVRRDPATDEEFLAQLYKGGELLAAGKVTEAKDHLERAYQLHPKNEKAQNLLGLTYFKLGLFERASEIYELLVNDNPADPTLRVNLGLVYLKTNNLMRSVREFETATDLEPGHKKAHNYLGLALAQAGDYARAREHFVISGSDAMAEKMAKAMVSAEAPMTVKMSPPPSAPPASVAAPAVTAPPPRGEPPPRSEDVQIEMMSDEEDVPPELDAPPVAEPPSPTTLVSQAQSMGGADLPPLPQPGFETVPEPKAPTLHADWGAQFGVDPPQTNGSGGLQLAGDGSPSAATSEAAVATGMQVPASVMVEADSDQMPLVATDEVIEATVEEVSESAVAMVEQNVLVPVEDSGALTEQPMPAEPERWTTEPPRLQHFEGEAGAADPIVAKAESELLTPNVEPELSAEEEFTGRQPTPEQVAAARELSAEDTISSPRAITRQPPSAPNAPPVYMGKAPSAEEEFTGQPAGVSAEEEFTGQPAPEYVAESEQTYTGQATEQYAAAEPSAEQEFTGQPAPEAEFVYEPAPGERREEVSDAEQEFVGAPAPEPAASLPSWVTGEASPPPEPEASSWSEPQPDEGGYDAPQAAPELQPGFVAIASPKLSDLGPRLDYGQSPASGPFHVGPEGLAVTVNGQMLCRLTGLVAVVGGVDAQPEHRRQRGRAIEQAFGEGTSQLQRVKGHGTLYLEPGKANFQAIDLDDEGCYVREERVFAFEEAVAFENGRLTAGQIGFEMVHLKGHGAVLLRLEGTLKAMAVPAGTPLKVPLARLVGWYGHVSPRVMVGFVGQATVELTGEGYALLAAPG